MPRFSFCYVQGKTLLKLPYPSPCDLFYNHLFGNGFAAGFYGVEINTSR